jgi:hypothetical protein
MPLNGVEIETPTYQFVNVLKGESIIKELHDFATSPEPEVQVTASSSAKVISKCPLDTNLDQLFQFIDTFPRFKYSQPGKKDVFDSHCASYVLLLLNVHVTFSPWILILLISMVPAGGSKFDS